MTTIPVKKDTAPPEFRKLAESCLYDNEEFIAWLDELVGDGNPIPDEHLEAAAMEAYVAFTEALDTWVETLIAGRPYDTPLVEWEHRELDKTQDVAEMLAEMGQARRELGAKR
ncbi:MAG: hypothetical protein IIC82_07520 [Chloroflexi bacterium]|nr:hypothetical protein [Chloroflexota bacterium]